MISIALATDPLPYDTGQLFDLAADIESYPRFLPGWVSARIVERDGNRLRVAQQLGLPLFSDTFMSTAQLDRPRSVHVQTSDGPFRSLELHWGFAAVDAAHSVATLAIECQMASTLLERPARRLLDAAAPSVMQRFAARARMLYGSGTGAE